MRLRVLHAFQKTLVDITIALVSAIFSIGNLFCQLCVKLCFKINTTVIIYIVHRMIPSQLYYYH